MAAEEFSSSTRYRMPLTQVYLDKALQNKQKKGATHLRPGIPRVVLIFGKASSRACFAAVTRSWALLMPL